MNNKITRFALLRHAETEWNSNKMIQGIQDSALTDKGKMQAETWGGLLENYGFDRIIVSPLGRARETCEIVNSLLKIPVTTEEDLKEQDWGAWTGATIAGLRKDFPEQVEKEEAAGWNFCPPEGEDRISVLNRSKQVLTSAGEKWPGLTILVIAHEGVIKCLLHDLCGRLFLPSEPLLVKKHHLHWLDHHQGKLRLESLNDRELP